jgi:hypothetical protein
MHAAIMNLHAGQMLQDTALSDLLERHSCEKAALDRVFVDASERDTPGEYIVSILCVILWCGRWQSGTAYHLGVGSSPAAVVAAAVPAAFRMLLCCLLNAASTPHIGAARRAQASSATHSPAG